MSGKLNVFTLGQLGINRVKSPIQVQDGELLQSQNATIKPLGKQLAISKRDGMVRLNSTDAAGKILAITNIPLVEPTEIPQPRLVSVADDGGTTDRIATSEDGITWTTRTAPSTSAWGCGDYSPALGRYAILAKGTTAGAYSSDGITWTAMTSASAQDWNEMIWAPELGLFVAVSSTTGGQQIQTSSDGINWTLQTTARTTTQWTGITWSPQLNLLAIVEALGNSSDQNIQTSPDAITWTARADGSGNGQQFHHSIAWSPALGIFCSVGNSSASAAFNRTWTSTNGTSWTPNTIAGQAAMQRKSIAWSPTLNLFCVVGNNGTGTTGISTSSNGTSWTAQTVPVTGRTWHDVIWSNELGLFVATANNSSGGTATQRCMTSPDGTNWTIRTMPNAYDWETII